MNKNLLIAVVALIALLSPLTSSAQFRYGPTASVDFTTLKFRQDLVSVDQVVGYSGGIAAEMMFPGIGFGIDLGLRYQQRGAKVNLGERLIWSSEGYGNERVYLHNIDIPVHLRFKYTRFNGFENYLAPFVYAGPTFSFLAGHSKIDAFKFAGGDVGIEVGVGAEILRNFQLSASYNWGITYALKTRLLTDFSARQRTWDIRATWFF